MNNSQILKTAGKVLFYVSYVALAIAVVFLLFKFTDVPRRSDIPSLSGYAEKSEIPDVSDFVRKATLDRYAETRDLAGYAKVEQLPKMDSYVTWEGLERSRYVTGGEVEDTVNRLLASLPVTDVVQAIVEAEVADQMVAQSASTITATGTASMAMGGVATTVTTGISGTLVAGSGLPRLGDVFLSPVTATKTFNLSSAWLIAEPGVLLDNTTAWTIGQVKAPYFVNVPEGGFTYFSLGQGVITVDGVSLVLRGENGLNYLVLIRGKIDDAIVDSDLNQTAVVSEFVPGHTIWSHMPTGAYVSYNWFKQQLVASTTSGYTDCGATGCSRVQVVLYDASSRAYLKYEVLAGKLTNWTLLEHN